MFSLGATVLYITVSEIDYVPCDNKNSSTASFEDGLLTMTDAERDDVRVTSTQTLVLNCASPSALSHLTLHDIKRKVVENLLGDIAAADYSANGCSSLDITLFTSKGVAFSQSSLDKLTLGELNVGDGDLVHAQVRRRACRGDASGCLAAPLSTHSSETPRLLSRRCVADAPSVRTSASSSITTTAAKLDIPQISLAPVYSKNATGEAGGVRSSSWLQLTKENDSAVASNTKEAFWGHCEMPSLDKRPQISKFVEYVVEPHMGSSCGSARRHIVVNLKSPSPNKPPHPKLVVVGSRRATTVKQSLCKSQETQTNEIDEPSPPATTDCTTSQIANPESCVNGYQDSPFKSRSSRRSLTNFENDDLNVDHSTQETWRRIAEIEAALKQYK